jgi:hypothetical protein
MAKKIQKNTKNIKTVDDTSIKKRESTEILYTEIDSPTTEQIIQELYKGTCTLFFYKISDSSFRKMRCTLSEEKPIPSKYNRQGVVVVWDLDASQWRSFYPNRVFKLIRNEKTDIQ